jgi:predicted ArsR family transcriptional regulator
LLGRALDRLPPDEAETMAEEVGEEYGRAMAEGLTGDGLATGRRSLRAAMQSVADALTAQGFAAHAEGRNGRLRIINDHCPFGVVAIEHPVICAVDRGMVRGMLAALVGVDWRHDCRRGQRVERRPRRHRLRDNRLTSGGSDP